MDVTDPTRSLPEFCQATIWLNLHTSYVHQKSNPVLVQLPPGSSKFRSLWIAPRSSSWLIDRILD